MNLIQEKLGKIIQDDCLNLICKLYGEGLHYLTIILVKLSLLKDCTQILLIKCGAMLIG